MIDKIIEIIKQYETPSENKEFDFVHRKNYRNLANTILQTIEVTRSCCKLKDKESMTFEEYLISKKYTKTDKGNWFKGMEILSSRDLINMRKAYKSL